MKKKKNEQTNRSVVFMSKRFQYLRKRSLQHQSFSEINCLLIIWLGNLKLKLKSKELKNFWDLIAIDEASMHDVGKCQLDVKVNLLRRLGNDLLTGLVASWYKLQATTILGVIFNLKCERIAEILESDCGVLQRTQKEDMKPTVKVRKKEVERLLLVLQVRSA